MFSIYLDQYECTTVTNIVLNILVIIIKYDDLGKRMLSVLKI